MSRLSTFPALRLVLSYVVLDLFSKLDVVTVGYDCVTRCTFISFFHAPLPMSRKFLRAPLLHFPQIWLWLEHPLRKNIILYQSELELIVLSDFSKFSAPTIAFLAF